MRVLSRTSLVVIIRVLIRVLLAVIFILGRGLFGRLLLLLLVLGLGVSHLGQRLLKDLENFLVRDLFVRLPLRDVWRWRSGQTLHSVLGYSW